MLRIQFAVLALFVVVRARAGSYDTVLEVRVGSNATAVPTCCSCSSNCTLEQISTSMAMLRFELTPPTKPKRDDYEYTSGVGAHKLHTTPVIWNEARRICVEEGGHLAIVNSQAEANVLQKILLKSGLNRKSTQPYLAAIGFHSMFKEGEYVTILDQSLVQAGYMKWMEGEPNNIFQNESCGAFHKDGGLNDIWCDVPMSFLCEMPDV